MKPFYAGAAEPERWAIKAPASPDATRLGMEKNGMNWYLEVMKKYAVFSGRARRKEYWFFILFNMIFAIVAMIVDNVLGIAIEGLGYGPIYILYGLAILLPNFGVLVRRLHDVGKSGWFFFITFIPIVGAIWLLVLLCRDGVQGDNQYGPNPKS